MKFGFIFTHLYDKKKILLNLALLYLRNHNCESQKTFNPFCKPLRKQSLWREKWVNALLLQWSSSFHIGLKFILEKYSCLLCFLNSWSNFSLQMASEGKGMNWKSVTETVLNLLICTYSRIQNKHTTVIFRFKHVRFKEVFRFKEEFHCSQNFST